MGERFEREDLRERARRDLEHRRRRAPESAFFRSVALVGSVGWPIVLLSIGGALLGRWADQRWDTGIRFTLTLVAVGAGLGSWMAMRSLRSPR